MGMKKRIRASAKKPARPAPGPLTRFLNPIAFLIGLGLIHGLSRYLPLYSLEGTAADIAAMLVGGLAVGLIGWTVLLFIRHKTTIEPFAGSTRLIDAGPFRISRNPIYLGFALLLLATALWTDAASTLIAPVLFVLVVDRLLIRLEERDLAVIFGADYARYRDRVRRWI